MTTTKQTSLAVILNRHGHHWTWHREPGCEGDVYLSLCRFASERDTPFSWQDAGEVAGVVREISRSVGVEHWG